MPLLVDHCPRCGAKSITFDITGANHCARNYDWQNVYELFSICRACHAATTFIAYQKAIEPKAVFASTHHLLKYDGSITEHIDVKGFISIRDTVANKPPEHMPSAIVAAFTEAAVCMKVQCWNAAAAMFRRCLELATAPLLPPPVPDNEIAPQGTPNAKIRRDLGLRLKWLFDNNKLPISLKELSGAVKEDGNDGVHGNSLTKLDAEDLQDFTVSLLERLFTEPKRLELAKQRREDRRKAPE